MGEKENDKVWNVTIKHFTKFNENFHDTLTNALGDEIEKVPIYMFSEILILINKIWDKICICEVK